MGLNLGPHTGQPKVFLVLSFHHLKVNTTSVFSLKQLSILSTSASVHGPVTLVSSIAV
jgi:hypothetical protein